MKEKTSLFANLKRDSISGLVVFLIALPLCLGIAQASGAPLWSGVVAGIIGGIVIGSLSGSNVSVAGPAAGLTAIVLAAIAELGAFDIFLCAVIVGGACQLILGFLKAGSIANYFPTSVIEGMLAGIGLTIIIKQIPDAVGYAKNDSGSMSGAEDGFSWDFVSQSLSHIETGAAVIALIGLAILFAWQTKPFQKLRLVPSGLIVVLLGTLINELFISNASPMALDASHLVNLPVPSNAREFIGQFKLPNIEGFANPKVWQVGVTIAAVASIETLLCIEATDKLDPLKRYTPTNRELKAQGLANMLGGLIGGLPMTSVIVRSSANINAGARSKFSTILHGTLLLVCAATIASLLNHIPKATLAAVLIYTGYRLCNPKIIKHIWKKGGFTQLIPFAATAIAVVSLDLLKGVGIGLIISIFYILRENMRIPYYYQRSSYAEGELIKLTLAQEVSFLNKASIMDTLDNIPEGSKVIIDASNTQYIDYDVLEVIREFYETKAPDKDITMSLEGFRNTYNVPATDPEAQKLAKLENGKEEPQEKSAGGYRKLIKQLTQNQ